MYDKESLELEDIRQMSQNNDSTEKALRSQRGISKSRGLKRDPEASSSFACYFCKKPGYIKKNCMKYKEILKRKGEKNSDGASTMKSQIKPGLSKMQMRIHVMS